MPETVIKISSKPSHKFNLPVFKLAAIAVLSVMLVRPLAALADDPTIINDANNTNNPAEQQATGGSPDNSVPVDTQAAYSTSTPDATTQTPDPSATSTDPSLTDASSTPDTTSTSTPDTSVLPPTDPSNASSTSDSTTTLEILNINNLNATTTATSTANTGLNLTQTDGDIKNATTTTGDVNVYANVLTVANINLVNSQIVEMNDTFNKLAADLYMNQPELSAGERTQDLVSPICSSGNVSCQSITTFKLTNQNIANIDNDVALNGNTGGNQMNSNGGDIKNDSITTGNVNAVVNVLNIVNANAVNSTWTIVTFNVFGGWTGDLIMPSELYFTDVMSLGANGNSDVSQVEKVILNINNSNDSSISNNVVVQTDTGDNIVQAVPDARGTSGDVKNVAVNTGASSAVSNVQNVTNLTVYNSEWFLGLINIMGNWSGHIYSLPSSVTLNYEPTGFTFVSSSDPALQSQLMSQLQTPVDSPTSTPADTAPADSQNQQNITAPTSTDPGSSSDGGGASASSTDITTVDINNSNQATINNNITVNATTGQNGITSAGGDIKYDSITTGNATALANVLNFANANLVNSDLYVGLVNIYGDWQGNIVFGYPDLSISQTVDQNPIPDAANSPVNINAGFANQGQASMADSRLEWKYDPTLFALNAAQASLSDGSQATSTYQTLAPGDIEFYLGKLAPNAAGNVDLQLTTLQDQNGGTPDNFFAHIFGNGPETNLDNNQNTLTVLTATNTPDSTGLAGDNPNSGDSGNTGGQNNNPADTNSGGGGGGGGGSSSGGGVPQGQVLSTSTSASNLQMPKVLGASTHLPRTGMPIGFTFLIFGAVLALLDKKFKLV